MNHYADLLMDLADASLLVLAKETGSGRILSPDQGDFRTDRWKIRRSFRNLLLASTRRGISLGVELTRTARSSFFSASIMCRLRKVPVAPAFTSTGTTRVIILSAR